jgi:hypothetical protein
LSVLHGSLRTTTDVEGLFDRIAGVGRPDPTSFGAIRSPPEQQPAWRRMTISTVA